MSKEKAEVKPVFICKSCGNIMNITVENQDDDSNSIVHECENCHNPIDWENQFPALNAYDFINTARDLFDISKKIDKENLENQYNSILKSTGRKIDKTLLANFVIEYEKILGRYPDNNDLCWIRIYDELEEVIDKKIAQKELDIDVVEISAAISVFKKNYFRKPFIIIVASLIEHMFNDYLDTVVEMILPPNGKEVFWGKYDHAGIQSALEIIDAFSDEKLKDKMDRYSNGFYDRWAELRQLRNGIIHSNNKYVTKDKVSQTDKLIAESVLVFSKLKAELYLK